MGKRQVSFFIENELWKKFHVKCAEKEVSKTDVLVKAVEEFVKR